MVAYLVTVQSALVTWFWWRCSTKNLYFLIKCFNWTFCLDLFDGYIYCALLWCGFFVLFFWWGGRLLYHWWNKLNSCMNERKKELNISKYDILCTEYRGIDFVEVNFRGFHRNLYLKNIKPPVDTQFKYCSNALKWYVWTFILMEV